MKKLISVLIIIFFVGVNLKAQAPISSVESGKIERLENFNSKFVTSRNVDIWLPDGYSKSKKYSVLYMHDGQMLYDSTFTWNKQAWDVDDVATKLFEAGKVKDFIVVGIWNGGATRHPDYYPQKPYENMTNEERSFVVEELKEAKRIHDTFAPMSDNYLKFLVKELKPYVDKNYSVHKDRNNTFIAGSSMGGLISMYAICEYPKVFGGVACMSTHWVGTFSLENNPIPNSLIKYLSENLPNPKNHKIYFDCGDETLDALYPDIQKRIDSVMITNGFDETNWLTKYFPGENHSEYSWKKRLHIPLEFLLGKE